MAQVQAAWETWLMAWHEAERPVTPQAAAAICGEYVQHLIAGASYYPCALPKGHDGGHRAGGTCFKHGTYLGEVGAVPECPQWPTCVQERPVTPQAEPGASEPKLDEDACVHCHHRPHLPTCSLISPAPGLLDEEIARKYFMDLGKCYPEETVVRHGNVQKCLAAIAEVRQRDGEQLLSVIHKANPD